MVVALKPKVFFRLRFNGVLETSTERVELHKVLEASKNLWVLSIYVEEETLYFHYNLKTRNVQYVSERQIMWEDFPKLSEIIFEALYKRLEKEKREIIINFCK